MEGTQKRERSDKRVFGAAFPGTPQGMSSHSFDFLKDIKKGEILHLRDDFRPFMRTRDWDFVDLFKSGGVFLHCDDEGFLQVKVKDIDWQAYRRKKQ